MRPCPLNSNCGADYHRWPYDTQNCSITLSSWFKHIDKVNITVRMPTTILAIHQIHSQDGQFLVLTNELLPVINNVTTEFKFYIAMQRHSVTRAIILLTAFLIYMLMNMIAMWLDPETTERLGLIGLNLYMQLGFMYSGSFSVPRNREHQPVIREFEIVPVYYFVSVHIV